MEQKEKQTWIRQPQEQDGDYFFNGKALVTANVHQGLAEQELMEIICALHQFCKRAKRLQLFADIQTCRWSKNLYY